MTLRTASRRRNAMGAAGGVAGTLLAMLALAASGTAQEDGAVLLRLRLEPGQTYRMFVTTQTDGSQTVVGRDEENHQFSEMVILSEVLAVGEDGAITMRGTYESIRLVQDGPMGRLEYDSTDPEAGPPQPLAPMAILVGASFTMTQAPDGSLVGVEGLEDLLPRMLDEMDVPPGPMRDEFEQSIGDQFGGETVVEMMRQAGPQFPEEAVAPGDSWTTSAQVEKPMPVDLETTWTLKERRDGVSYVEARSSRSSVGSVGMGQSFMTMDVSGEVNTTAEVDEATGLTLRLRAVDESSGTMTVTGSPMGEVVMPVTTRTVTTVELLPGR